MAKFTPTWGKGVQIKLLYEWIWHLKLRHIPVVTYTIKSTQEWVARVRVCNFSKFETGLNLPPVLKIVTRPAHAA